MLVALKNLFRPAMRARRHGGEGRPIVFMHIMKTASTPARVALLMRWPDRPHRMLMRPNDLADAWRTDPWTFAGFRLIWGHFGTEFMRRFRFPLFSATFVRDPVERVLSNYLFWKEVDLAGLPADSARQLAECRREPLAKLLQSATPFVRAHLFDSQAKQIAARSAIEPGAVEFDYGEDLFTRARAEAARFDFIGFQDTLEWSMDRLFATLGASPAPPLARREVNATARSPENLAVRADRDLRRLIRRCNEIDIALYEALAAERNSLRATEP
ncbi:MAG: sulfotransferase family 2 domain-containing protein [Xanthobacteraceae bacterium]